ncbi:Cupredoxin [Podospora aff. communis PSN243]|uniref:Cupredoxin n=1 Tax=Podospora aff. communis PSN243 TaxID=3040156 RepID=A0AAV9GQP1_9PEZI|nr:Cupredoxin [Podospora aff. communis PSN243]
MGFLSQSVVPLSLLASLASAAHHVVTVGKGNQLRFDPETLTAMPGDTITYNYFAKNHSVTQSSFDKPCQPLAGGFFSGFVPTDSADIASRTTFTITVNDTKPIWIYCSQTNGNHCQNGMVHAINAPPQGNTFPAFKALAAKAPTSTSPSDGLPVGGLRKTTVDVGLDGALTYSPNNINEPPRTVVEFSFNPRNHTVTQSSFDKPCFPLPNNAGFSSGFIATTQSVPGLATFELVINDTKPIWFYCGQVNGNHCQAGMVGAINAPVVGNTLDAFIAKAKLAPPPSVIPPVAPLGGKVFVKGQEIVRFNLNGGNAIDVDKILGIAPPPATATATDKTTVSLTSVATGTATGKTTVTLSTTTAAVYTSQGVYPPAYNPWGTGKPMTMVTVTRPYGYGGKGQKPEATKACDSGAEDGEWKTKGYGY